MLGVMNATCLVAFATVCGCFWITEAADYQISLTATNIDVVENSGVVTVVVSRAAGGEGTCSASFCTIGRTAVSSRDYAPTNGRVEFAETEAERPLLLSLVSDSVPEPTKRFSIALAGYSNCVAGAITNTAIIIRDSQTMETQEQDFESGLPAGWSVVANTDTNGVWRFDNPGARPNNTGGTGAMATVDSDYIGEIDVDTELRTAAFPVASTALTYLVFKTYYVYCSGYEVADVDLSLDGEAGPWTNLWRQAGHDYGPVTEMIDLTPLAKGQSNAMVRFHYYNANYDWYWEIDDVALLVESDSNTNGLPDWWETAYYACLTNLDALSDMDDDGASASNEFVAGTSPTDSGSCFRVSAFVFTNGVSNVSFPTELGHFYDFRSSPDLADQVWTTRVTRLPGTGGVTNLTAPASAPYGFYRLDVQRW